MIPGRTPPLAERSTNSSSESITRSGIVWWERTAPVARRMASTSVVLPWSTWATSATLRRAGSGWEGPASRSAVVVVLGLGVGVGVLFGQAPRRVRLARLGSALGTGLRGHTALTLVVEDEVERLVAALQGACLLEAPVSTLLHQKTPWTGTVDR